MTGKSLHPATLAAQALGWTEASTGGIVLPLHTSTTFLREVDRASIEVPTAPLLLTCCVSRSGSKTPTT
jgi:hypothetical protein